MMLKQYFIHITNKNLVMKMTNELVNSLELYELNCKKRDYLTFNPSFFIKFQNRKLIKTLA